MCRRLGSTAFSGVPSASANAPSGSEVPSLASLGRDPSPDHRDQVGEGAQVNCLAEAGKGPDRRMPSPAKQGGLCTPFHQEPQEVLLLLFLRRLLLFFPRAAEPSERTEELWMLALSKSDSSRSSSSLCGGGGGPCEPTACPGGSS